MDADADSSDGVGERVARLTGRLRADARRADERRLLVLAGAPGSTRERARAALTGAGLGDAVYVGPADVEWAERVPPDRTERLLGRTLPAVVLDTHAACRPNAIGRAVGAVDGGGLLLLLAPPLSAWPDRRDGFDATLAVPPYDREAVTGHFRRRLVATLRAHPGVAVVGPDGAVERDGLTDPAPRRPAPEPDPPTDGRFPPDAYRACLTADQADAVAAFEWLLPAPRDDPDADATPADRGLVLEAHRGRGKSSAAGLAAASLACEGRDVLVTAPAYRNAREVFDRAADLLDRLDALAGRDRPEDPRRLATASGAVRFESPDRAADLPGDPDAVVVDEAAALPVDRLSALAAAPATAFATTVHGYEGAGRGFDVRFRGRLEETHDVREVSLATPIRYAPGDPVEVWAFRALALDARPPVDPLVADATPETTTYERLSGEGLADDESLLRATFGLLVAAHYRTEPDDLARLLDGPNVAVRALLTEGHPVSVALLAREGGLSADRRARMYEGERVRGNMLPDVLTSQLRDEAAGRPTGWRGLRVATHAAARSRGLGSRLLAEVRAEARERGLDYLGVGFGATPELVDFWAANGFHTVHLSTTRNDRSGEYSALMADPLTEAGRRLVDRHTDWFLRRVGGVLADPVDDADPAVVRAVLRATDGTPAVDLADAEWRTVVGAAEGAAIYDTAPRPFRRLALRHLVAPAEPNALDERAERLLVRKVLQARPWEEVASALDYESTAECKRALGRAGGVLATLYGGETVRVQRERFG